jgi:hypothetical protein
MAFPRLKPLLLLRLLHLHALRWGRALAGGSEFSEAMMGNPWTVLWFNMI